MDISIIILNYKSKGHTLNCIKSIKEARWDNLRYEIIVVDNNSEDEIGKILAWQHSDVKFIQCKDNLGMGGGNNVGIKKALGKYIVIMNPDTIAFSDTFIDLYEYMEKHKAVGIVGPKQLNPDKSVQDSCYRWHSTFTPIFRRTPLGRLKIAKRNISNFLMQDFDHKSEKEVDWLLGSFLFMRADFLKILKGFDERFFMYFEDTDLCRRFWQKNWKVVYYPRARIIHNHARQSAEAEWWKFFLNPATRWHIKSWIKYLYKWK